MKPQRISDDNLLEQVRNIPCICCMNADPAAAREAVFEGGQRSHPHHVKTKKSGGPDLPHNIVPLCFTHHRRIHDRGTRTLAAEYPLFRSWLECGGWSYDEFLGWMHPDNHQG